jgi:hypothetical protein
MACRCFSGAAIVAAEFIDALIAVAEKHSLASYHACGLARMGELLVARGEIAVGLSICANAPTAPAGCMS